MSLIRCAFLATLAGLVSASCVHTPPHPIEWVGTWQVDLRPTPDADSYYKELVMTSVDGNSIAGTFYGSPMKNGRLNSDWGDVRFAFVTRDGSGVYHTAGVLSGRHMSGTTHSLGRDFLSVWTAERVR